MKGFCDVRSRHTKRMRNLKTGKTIICKSKREFHILRGSAYNNCIKIKTKHLNGRYYITCLVESRKNTRTGPTWDVDITNLPIPASAYSHSPRTA